MSYIKQNFLIFGYYNAFLDGFFLIHVLNSAVENNFSNIKFKSVPKSGIDFSLTFTSY